MSGFRLEQRGWQVDEDAELLAMVSTEEDFDEASQALGRPVEACVDRYERLTGLDSPAAVERAVRTREAAMVAQNLADGGFARPLRLGDDLHFVALGCDGRPVVWRAP